MLKTGIIFDIIRYSIHDGPGIRTTVFFKGCPLSCLWCHNPESQSSKQEIFFWEDRCIGCGDCIEVCTTRAINSAADCILCKKCVEVCCTGARETVGKAVTKDNILAEIEKDVVFYDQSSGGVTFSGGEPLLQGNFLLDLLRCCQEREIHTAVDTTGFGDTKSLLQIASHVDLFLYDLKMMDEEKHKMYTGVSNYIILKNLQELSQIHNHIIVRLPLIPKINDDENNIKRTGEYLASLKNIKKVHILPYHNTGLDKYKRLHKEYKLRETKTPSNERITTVKKQLVDFGLQVQIGG